MSENLLSINIGGSQWIAYKDLLKTVNAAVINREHDNFQDLEVALRTYKRDFLTIFKNLPKKAESREAVKKATTDGIRVLGYYGTKVLSQSQIDEALILSDLFDLNEAAALELLLLAESQQSKLSTKTRGLAAIVLYYDSRLSLVSALRLLIQTRSGRSWTLGASNEITDFITRFTSDLWNEGLCDQIFCHLESFKLDEERARLEEKRALGDTKHRKLILDLIEDTQTTLAECLYCWSCQSGLDQSQALRLLNILANITPARADGNLDGMQFAMLVASLYSLDLTTLASVEDSDELLRKFPIILNEEFIPSIHKELLSQKQWVCQGLRAIIQFAWAVSLRTLSQISLIQGGRRQQCIDDDEALVELALEGNVLNSIRLLIIGSPYFFSEEFYYRRFHGIITDFIVNMPLKIKELRNRGDEVARIIAHSDPNLNRSFIPPIYFSMLMDVVSDLYSKDPLNLELNTEYWCPTETPFQLHRTSPLVANPSQKQVNLYKFILLAGEFLPPSLYIPYIKMLKSLSSSTAAANHCFHLLKPVNNVGGSQYGIVSWDHFFGSFQRYAASLIREYSTDGISQPRSSNSSISPQEVEGLQVVLELIETVAINDEVARSTFCENMEWNPLSTFLTLVCCPIPVGLKSQIICTLSSLVRNSYVAVSLWQNLENSGILPTHSDGGKSNIQIELDEMESQCEVYPLTCSFLKLLSVLVDTFQNLDASGQEINAQFDCCVVYVINNVFAKFHLRSYKSQSEKWQVASLCLEFLAKLVSKYQPDFDFSDVFSSKNNVGYPSSGQLIVTNMLQNSLLLKTVLGIIDEVSHIYDQCITVFPGKVEIETCSLLCLKLILRVLELQDTFISYVKEKKLSVLIVGLDHLLMGINPRTNQADHVLRISRFISYNATLPEHAYYAIEILSYMLRSISLQPAIVGSFSTSPDDLELFRRGIVECLEVEDDETQTQVSDDSRFRCNTRESILRMLISSLNNPKPTLAMFLLGFDLKKNPLNVTLQDAGVLNVPYTCLHIILEILSQNNSSSTIPVTAELCQQLIYTMCCHGDISVPTMRYLRSSHDFFEHQLGQIPFAIENSDKMLVTSSVLNRQSWLLKTIAIELRVAAVSGQRSNLHRLLSLLVDNKSSSEMIEANRSRPKLLGILEDLRMTELQSQIPQWDYFDASAVEKIIAFCQRSTSSGFKATDIRVLHKLLSTEVRRLQGTITIGQQPLVSKEIQSILEYATLSNQNQMHLYSKRVAVEAWRHITETVIATMSDDFLDLNKRVTIILELIHHYLQKISDDSSVQELISLSSSVLITLFSSLRQNFVKSSATTWKAYSSSIEVALRGLINCILKSENGPYKIRANYYAGLLSLLKIGFKLEVPRSRINKGLDIVDNDTFLHTNLDIINNCEQDLFEILCHDMCSVNDVAKMLALSCLSAMVSGDRNESLLKFLAGHGYVKECVNSLRHDDGALSSLPIYRTDNLRKLYVYETKMTFFIHLATTAIGAKIIVFSGLLEVLASMRAFDNQLVNPISDSIELREQGESNPWDDAVSAFHQILVPVLKICVLLLSSSSGLLMTIRSQITHFLVSHLDTFSFILRKTKLTDKVLEEHALVCAVVTKVLVGDYANEDYQSELETSVPLSRLLRLAQNLFASLVTSKFTMNDCSNIHFNETTTSDDCKNDIKWDTTIVSLLSFFSSRIGLSDMSNITFGPTLKLGGQMKSFPEYTAPYARNLHHLQDLGLLVFIIKYATFNYLTIGRNHSRTVGSHAQPHSIWNPQIEEIRSDTIEDPLQQSRLRLLLTMLEKTLHLLWFHLDFYLQSSTLKSSSHRTTDIFSEARILKDYQDSLLTRSTDPSNQLDKHDLENFKTECAVMFNDTLLGRVVEISRTTEDAKDGHFLAVMVRRIKWLTQTT